MRGRVIASFALGFAVGVLLLGAGLWSSGKLQTSVTPPWLQHQQTVAPQSGGLPDTSTSAQLQPAPEPPPPIQPPTTAPATTASTMAPGTMPPTTMPATTGSASRAAGDADRSVVDAPTPMHLGMPLDGINPEKLNDTFHEGRHGHVHEALDILAPKGTPVKAVAEGNVAKLFTSKDGGLTVYQFDNSGKFCFYYAHLDHYAPGLKEGMLLRKGDVLGFVGTTGDAPPSTPHLHLAVFKLGPEKQWWKGDAIDPLPLLK